MAKRYSWTLVKRAPTCAKGSMRTVRSKSGSTLIRVCCPKGHFKAGHCTTGTKAYEVGTLK